MIEGDGAHGREVAQIVLVGRVVAVPGHHVERRVADLGDVELAAPLDGEARLLLPILERRPRCLDVAGVGKAIERARTWLAEQLKGA